MKQQAITRLENPNYGKATLTTLKRIAAAFDVGLVVWFVPFSQLADWVSGTPYVELGLRPESMRVPNFDEEERLGNFAPSPRWYCMKSLPAVQPPIIHYDWVVNATRFTEPIVPPREHHATQFFWMSKSVSPKEATTHVC